MTDKTLLQAARDALNEEHGKMVAIADIHPNLVLIPKSPSDCEVCQLILRLDAELAKVAEPVDEGSFRIEFTPGYVYLDRTENGSAIVRNQPVVLDLSGVDRWRFPPNEGLDHFRQVDLLAAIRAQLPGVVVKC